MHALPNVACGRCKLTLEVSTIFKCSYEAAEISVDYTGDVQEFKALHDIEDVDQLARDLREDCLREIVEVFA